MLIELTVQPPDNFKTLAAFMRGNGISAALIKKLKFLPNGILVDGVKQNTDYKVKTGEKVTFFTGDTFLQAKESNVIPQDIQMEILYMDNSCMVVNKPYYMPVHPSLNHPKDTLANAFCGYWQKKGSPKIYRVINRLDKNTSGLVIIALDSFSAEKLKNSVKKIYTAIAQGKVAPKEGIIEQPVARTENSIITRCVSPMGQYAKTEYITVKQNEQFTLLDIKLHTGRTHQIRVHFSYIGHPLAGDDMYGGSREVINRHALHCRRLSFISPDTGEYITVDSPLPKDMADIVKEI